MTAKTEEIKKNIVDSLYWDTRVDASDVGVEVYDGYVKLTGTVPTVSARQAAEEDAYYTGGIGYVDNQIIVQYPEGIMIPTDEQILANLKSVYTWNPDIDESKISLSVEQGTVTLKGSVETFWKKIRAEELALNITGVFDVRNELAVIPTGLYSDLKIAEDVMEALRRNKHLDTEQINVEVSDGIVTLRGKVKNWIAYRDVANYARFTMGVKDVINSIEIEGAVGSRTR